MPHTPFTAKVTHLSAQGLGVLKDASGQTFFARGVWPGDEGEFVATEEREGAYRFAELRSLREASAERQAVPCPHLGLGEQDCYGCPWMIASYPAQLRQKEHRIRYALARVGFQDPPVAAIWPAPDVLQYRCRAQFKTDGTVLGYAGRQGRSIAPIEDCLILSPTMRGLLQGLRQRLPQTAWRPEAPHHWVFIDLDEESSLDHIVLNRRRPFQQANKAQNLRMRAWIAERTATAPGPFLELFAGSGNFTELLSAQGRGPVLAIEVAAAAVRSLEQRGWPEVKALRLDLYQPTAPREIQTIAPDTRTLIVNPPRDGLRHLHRLPRLLPNLEQILYVSCEPTTLAHDLKRLSEQGFVLKTVQALDPMPHTPHLEVLVHLQRG